jgi:hypothetical protein
VYLGFQIPVITTNFGFDYYLVEMCFNNKTRKYVVKNGKESKR